VKENVRRVHGTRGKYGKGEVKEVHGATESTEEKGSK
jgi:hypothetical protein